jgi:hypothetical protein
MKLDYIPNINEFGENIVRLYDFDMSEAILFKQIIQETILTDIKQLDLSTVDFIEARNCNLILRPSDMDEGIVTDDDETFYCYLTLEGYKQMITLLEPFCVRETKGYQWLYDVDNQTDFLFSPGGTW